MPDNDRDCQENFQRKVMRVAKQKYELANKGQLCTVTGRPNGTGLESVGAALTLMRKNARLTQADLATGMRSSQPLVARAEGPSYRAHSLKYLTQVARACDFSVQVVFVKNETTQTSTQHPTLTM